jgi:hypothetical protein
MYTKLTNFGLKTDALIKKDTQDENNKKQRLEVDGRINHDFPSDL